MTNIKAICTYCQTANLYEALECRKCGGSLAYPEKPQETIPVVQTNTTTEVELYLLKKGYQKQVYDFMAASIPPEGFYTIDLPQPHFITRLETWLNPTDSINPVIEFRIIANHQITLYNKTHHENKVIIDLPTDPTRFQTLRLELRSFDLWQIKFLVNLTRWIKLDQQYFGPQGVPQSFYQGAK